MSELTPSLGPRLTRRQLLAGGAKLAGAAAALHLSPSAARAMSMPAGADEPLTLLQLNEGWEFFKDLSADRGRFGTATSCSLLEVVMTALFFNAMDGCDPEVSYYRGPGRHRDMDQPKNPYRMGMLLHFWARTGNDGRISAPKS